MSRVTIVTDSTADVPSTLASELGISVVACQVFLGQEMYRDGTDISSLAFYDRLSKSSQIPRTSQPPVHDFLSTYRQLLDEEPDAEIVSIHLAASFSGTVNAAWAAAQMMPDASRVEVIDSGQLSMGLGWAVIEAARSAQNGATRAEIGRSVRALLPRLRTAAMIDTLENLYKGGRISQIAATLGTVLQIKPLLDVREGQVAVWGKVRTRAKALGQLVAYVRDWGRLVNLAVLHTGAEDLANSLANLLDGLVPSDRLLIAPAGQALTSHLGLGAVGVCALLSEDN